MQRSTPAPSNTLDHRAQVSRTVSFLTGDGAKDTTIQVLGKLRAVNAAISSLSFLPAEGYEGDASITITTQVVAMAGRVDIRPNTETITIAISSSMIVKPRWRTL